MAHVAAQQSESVDGWCSSPEYQSSIENIPPSTFYQVTDVLLERPNLNSTHLFRADILFDDSGKLQTNFEKEQLLQQTPGNNGTSSENSSAASLSQSSQEGTFKNEEPPTIPGFERQRTIVRRLIPRKPQFDLPLEQSCFVYTETANQPQDHASVLVVYVPHTVSEKDMPWYHPKVKALMYRFRPCEGGAVISVHYQLFPTQESNAVTDRIHRTMMSLVQTFVRLTKMPSLEKTKGTVQHIRPSMRDTAPAALKDTILPQHIVQDTYTRLKQTYASDIISRWVEKTDPSKHVFEDLAIAAFLIELWNNMYRKDEFPGFVDMACGNGLLVYVLIKEGYRGRGFDARRRRSWEILGIQEHLEEKICVPQPFLDYLYEEEIEEAAKNNIVIHDGLSDPDTFIISNHADELTLWTPLLAALSSRERYNPFLAIPCCSHALSGARHRYGIREVDVGLEDRSSTTTSDADDHGKESKNEQPTSGDLKAMRAQKSNVDQSMYACLTKKTVSVAEDIGFETEMTLMRIPSTRNIAVVGNRQQRMTADPEKARRRILQVVQWECRPFGGVRESALTWFNRAKKHMEGQGRGKVNLGKKMEWADVSHAIEDVYE